jgi:hypothetical protein
MLKNVDRTFGCLLILAALGHTAGTLKWIPFMSGMFVWSMGSSLAAGLLGALNIVRAGRSADTTLAAITVAGTAAWMVLALAFGQSIGNLLDPRPLGHAIIAGVLVVFGGMTLRRGIRREQQARRNSHTSTRTDVTEAV